VSEPIGHNLERTKRQLSEQTQQRASGHAQTDPHEQYVAIIDGEATGAGVYTATQRAADGSVLNNPRKFDGVDFDHVHDIEGEGNWYCAYDNILAVIARGGDGSQEGYWYIVERLDKDQNPVTFTDRSGDSPSTRIFDRRLAARSNAGNHDSAKFSITHLPQWGTPVIRFYHRTLRFGALGRLIKALNEKVFKLRGENQRTQLDGYIAFKNEGSTSAPDIVPKHNSPKSYTSSTQVKNPDGSVAGRIYWDEAGHIDKSAMPQTIQITHPDGTAGITTCSSPAAGQLLRWNHSSGCWEPTTIEAELKTISGYNASNEQYLKNDSGTLKWLDKASC